VSEISVAYVVPEVSKRQGVIQRESVIFNDTVRRKYVESMTDGWYLWNDTKTYVLGENPVRMPLCLPYPHVVNWDRTVLPQWEAWHVWKHRTVRRKVKSKL